MKLLSFYYKGSLKKWKICKKWSNLPFYTHPLIPYLHTANSTLNLITWNIRSFHTQSKRLKVINHLIKWADICFLQEMHWTDVELQNLIFKSVNHTAALADGLNSDNPAFFTIYFLYHLIQTTALLLETSMRLSTQQSTTQAPPAIQGSGTPPT